MRRTGLVSERFGRGTNGSACNMEGTVDQHGALSERNQHLVDLSETGRIDKRAETGDRPDCRRHEVLVVDQRSVGGLRGGIEARSLADGYLLRHGGYCSLFEGGREHHCRAALAFWSGWVQSCQQW